MPLSLQRQQRWDHLRLASVGGRLQALNDRRVALSFRHQSQSWVFQVSLFFQCYQETKDAAWFGLYNLMQEARIEFHPDHRRAPVGRAFNPRIALPFHQRVTGIVLVRDLGCTRRADRRRPGGCQ